MGENGLFHLPFCDCGCDQHEVPAASQRLDCSIQDERVNALQSVHAPTFDLIRQFGFGDFRMALHISHDLAIQPVIFRGHVIDRGVICQPNHAACYRLAIVTAILERAHRKGFVFGLGRAGEPPTQEATSLQITRVMRRLGLRGVSHHTMRHTGVTLMLEAGVNPRVIQKLAGWTTLRMLERYGHARDAEAQRAVTTMHTLLQSALERPASQGQDTPSESDTTRAHTRAQS
jgi:Phage integrase family